MKINQVVQLYKDALNDIYDQGELAQVIFLVFEQVKNFSKIDFVLKRDEAITTEEEKKFKQILSELKTHKPVQYVLGSAWFYGMKFNVNENVLIPRQETEELVNWIMQDIKDKSQEPNNELTILDICTGSGCIAISLKKNVLNASVIALDISEAALAVANENAKKYDAEIQFCQTDILLHNTSPFTAHSSFNMIVSNPPYVLETEKQLMTKKELDYEPHLAMFVFDTDPLIFYRRISEFGLVNLKPNGKLYFEINESKGNEIVALLTNSGYSEIQLKKDLNGKDRMIAAKLKTKNKNQEPGTKNQKPGTINNIK